MKTYLKVKLKHLGVETKIIKAEERKWPGKSIVRKGLYHHRIQYVKSEIRATHIAYGFLKGQDYKVIESGSKIFPSASIWSRVYRMIDKYGKPYFPSENDLNEALITFQVNARMYIKNKVDAMHTINYPKNKVP